MQDMIPVSVDDRRFTIWNRLEFLFLTTFITYYFALVSFITLGLIWRNIWVGDFTQTDLIRAVVLTVIAAPVLVAVFGAAFRDNSHHPFVRGSLLLDPRASRLILKGRHITGLSHQKSLSFADVRDINVTWCESEDGKEFLQLALIPRGRPIHPAITNPADAANLPAFEARLRAAMVAAGWSDPRRLWMSTR